MLGDQKDPYADPTPHRSPLEKVSSGIRKSTITSPTTKTGLSSTPSNSKTAPPACPLPMRRKRRPSLRRSRNERRMSAKRQSRPHLLPLEDRVPRQFLMEKAGPCLGACCIVVVTVPAPRRRNQSFLQLHHHHRNPRHCPRVRQLPKQSCPSTQGTPNGSH